MGLRNAAARGASPVARAHGVKNALSGDSDLGLERRHSTHPGSFLIQQSAVRAILMPVSTVPSQDRLLPGGVFEEAIIS